MLALGHPGPDDKGKRKRTDMTNLYQDNSFNPA